MKAMGLLMRLRLVCSSRHSKLFFASMDSDRNKAVVCAYLRDPQIPNTDGVAEKVRRKIRI
jgi:hypothetical protein